MRHSRHMYLCCLLPLLIILACPGCAIKPTPTVEKITPSATPNKKGLKKTMKAGDTAFPDGFYTHIVRVPEENLSIIAKWYTGEKKNWAVLAKCNPGLNPNRIFLGDKIKIPRSLMTRKTALPADFVKQSLPYPQPKKKKQIPQQKNKIQKDTVEEDKEPILFGPKTY